MNTNEKLFFVFQSKVRVLTTSTIDGRKMKRDRNIVSEREVTVTKHASLAENFFCR